MVDSSVKDNSDIYKNIKRSINQRALTCCVVLLDLVDPDDDLTLYMTLSVFFLLKKWLLQLLHSYCIFYPLHIIACSSDVNIFTERGQGALVVCGS